MPVFCIYAFFFTEKYRRLSDIKRDENNFAIGRDYLIEAPSLDDARKIAEKRLLEEISNFKVMSYGCIIEEKIPS